jgi:hypothetical protein
VGRGRRWSSGGVEKNGGEEGSVGVLDWPAAAGLKRPDGIGCRRGDPCIDIEVTSPCVGRCSRLPMPGRLATRRGGATDGQAARLAFDQHSYCPLCRCHAGPMPTREDTGGHRACPRRRIGDPNLVDRCIGPVASYRWSMRNRCAGPVGRVRTRAAAMRRPAGDALTKYMLSVSICKTFQPLL